MSRKTACVVFSSVLPVLAATGALSAARAEFRETAAFDARSLVLENLIGEIRVEGAAGSKFEVEVNVRGRDATPEAIRIQRTEGESASLVIHFPVDRATDFVYPALGTRSSTTIHTTAEGDHGWLSSLLGLGRDRIHVSGAGSGMEVWADAVVKVPDGRTVEVRHGVGTVVATRVDGVLTLGVRSGAVEASSIRGRLTVDTGSGDVRVEDVTGPTDVDTGSGSVKLTRAEGPEILLDTGSGDVDAQNVTCDRLSIDTGSGGVRARAVRAGSAAIDTGSGSVELALDALSDGKFEVDTGSGSITLVVPADASARVGAETGSGGIRVGLDGIRVIHQERDEMQFQVGGGAARVTLETGSGGIEIRPAG